MSARERVAAARAALSAGAVVVALLWGVAAALGVLAAAAFADWTIELPRAARASVLSVAIVTGLAVASAVLWRARRARALSAVALWLEEQLPSLRYALVTALEAPDTIAVAPLEREIAGAPLGRVVRRALGRAALAPAAALVVAIVLLITLPAGVVARVRAPRPGDALLRVSPGAPAPVNRLATIVATVAPPAYTGERTVTLEDPANIKGLVASRVTLEGRGRAGGLEARLGASALDVAEGGAGWRVSFAMPAHAAALRMRDGRFERLLVLEPRPDSLPVVTLAAPARDTVVRTPTGVLPLVARATDDFGLDALWFEYIVSSGEGESFTFRSGVLRRTSASGARQASLQGALPLDSLALKPGDIVHIRAVARDRNDATGPGIGVSETRALRVPRPSEYDSVAVEGAPPPEVDKSQLSERMLITLAEGLEKRRPSLPRARVVAESQAIGADQARLRKQVGEIIFARLGGQPSGEEASGDSASRARMTPEELLRAADASTQGAAGAATDFEGDETPVVAVNRPLLEAYNAMWDATRELNIGEPDDALPHMRAALAAIQRARQAERLYLRGKAPVVIVDLAKVRLAGKRDEAAAAARTPRVALDTTAARRAARLDDALRLLSTDARAAVDSLLVLRVDALESAPAFAAALAPAIDALRAGRDATDALVRARRAVMAGGVSEPASPLWGGAW